MTTAITEWLAVARRIYPDAEICDECRGCGQAHTVDGRCSGCRGAGFVPQRPSWMTQEEQSPRSGLPIEIPYGMHPGGSTAVVEWELYPWSLGPPPWGFPGLGKSIER